MPNPSAGGGYTHFQLSKEEKLSIYEEVRSSQGYTSNGLCCMLHAAPVMYMGLPQVVHRTAHLRAQIVSLRQAEKLDQS